MGNETAIFGGGCFWCIEAAFSELKGVISVMPGYAGGHAENPNYEAVSSGNTGHAEVVKVVFNPNEISYDDLLAVFFAVHDPTTLNRQGNDVGTQYRSIILYTSDDQREKAKAFIKKLDKGSSPKIVTELEKLEVFFEAEDNHRSYYKNNPDQPYCQIVISPKLDKLKEKFSSLVRKAD